MKKTPIAIILDDPTPRVSVYYEHNTHPLKQTRDGRPLITEVPNSFLVEFCNVIEKYGISGKFSIVPMPGGRGDIVNGIEGFPMSEISEWLTIVKERVGNYFSFCPEMLTHAKTADLVNGGFLDQNESHWSYQQDASTLTPYIAKALSLLKEAGIAVTGVSSPWDFGRGVEGEYEKAIMDAMEKVYGKKDSWFFLGSMGHGPKMGPWLEREAGGKRLVSIPATIGDKIWQTIDTADTSEAYVLAVADEILTADGTGGEIRKVLDAGGTPIMLTHWQSLYSNGLKTGLRVLEEVGRRVKEHLSDQVEWMKMEDVMKRTLDESV